jgi:hypothetical protein
LTGASLNATDNYDIDWTVPVCILVLRLTGLAFDIQDGALPDEKKSADQVCMGRIP